MQDSLHAVRNLDSTLLLGLWTYGRPIQYVGLLAVWTQNACCDFLTFSDESACSFDAPPGQSVVAAVTKRHQSTVPPIFELHDPTGPLDEAEP